MCAFVRRPDDSHLVVFKTPLDYFAAVSSRYAESVSAFLPSTLPDICHGIALLCSEHTPKLLSRGFFAEM